MRPMTEPAAEGVAVIVAARDEADLIAATLAALPGRLSAP